MNKYIFSFTKLVKISIMQSDTTAIFTTTVFFKMEAIVISCTWSRSKNITLAVK